MEYKLRDYYAGVVRKFEGTLLSEATKGSQDIGRSYHMFLFECAENEPKRFVLYILAYEEDENGKPQIDPDGSSFRTASDVDDLHAKMFDHWPKSRLSRSVWSKAAAKRSDIADYVDGIV